MDDTNERPRLGASLRALRTRHGWTLAHVSSRTGLSITTLSKVENDRISLSYDKLVRLSEGLEIDIEELFALPGESGAQAVVSGRRSINAAGGGTLVATRNYDYRYLSTELVHKKFHPIETDVRARTIEEFGPLVKHSGEEFIYVIEGEVEVHTELYAPFILKAGESAYLDSSMGHAYVARREPARVLGICSHSDMRFCEPAPAKAEATRKPLAPARPRKRARGKKPR